MTTQAELYADIEGFEPGYEGIYAVVNLYGKDDSGARERTKWEWADYPRFLIPERGRYQPAKLGVTVTTAAEPQEVEQAVGPVESVAEFEAEVFEMDIERPVFWLRNIDDETRVGQMELEPDRLSGWLENVGDRCYVTVQMEYLHERSVDVLGERRGKSETDIERRRENMQELFEELEKEYL